MSPRALPASGGSVEFRIDVSTPTGPSFVVIEFEIDDDSSLRFSNAATAWSSSVYPVSQTPTPIHTRLTFVRRRERAPRRSSTIRYHVRETDPSGRPVEPVGTCGSFILQTNAAERRGSVSFGINHRSVGESRREQEREAAPAAGDAPTAPEPRYANAVLLGARSDDPLDGSEPLEKAQLVRIRLDIGPLSAASHVDAPKPFPVEAGAPDVWLDVVVSSTHFGVGAEPPDHTVGGTATGRFFLPGNGEPATTVAGEPHLFFYLRVPERSHLARARVGYYYRNALLQSQLLEAVVGDFPAPKSWPDRFFSITTDFTTTETLTGLESIPERPRVSVLVNGGADGSHQFVVRGADATEPDGREAESFELDDRTIGRALADFRRVLRARAPTTRRRRKDQLIRDLRELAPLGWDLYAATAGQSRGLLDAAFHDPKSLVIQVCRPRTSSFTLPWGCLYEIPIESIAVQQKEVEICELVADWDDTQPLLAGTERGCPAANGGQHRENVLCPFGFWAFRYSIEQLASTREKLHRIKVGSRFDMVVAETQYEVDKTKLAAHIDELRNVLQARFPEANIVEGKSRTDVKELLARDTPLIYFYCHGERPRAGDPNTYLGVGVKKPITPSDFIGWVSNWRRHDRKVVWENPRPLILINACHSAEINPDTLVSYIDAFIGAGNAAGLIGTEVKVNQDLAMQMAEGFYKRFLASETVDSALRAMRFEFLATGNLLGLAYTPYCWADLALARTNAP